MSTPTVTFDATFFQHRKVCRAIALAGPATGWLYVKSVCWSAVHRTDGSVSSEQALALASDPQPDGVLFIPVAGAAAVIDALVAAGLWTRTESGFVIHDFADYQETTAKIDQRRDRWRRQKRRQRRSSRGPRGRPADPPRTPSASQLASSVIEPTASVPVQREQDLNVAHAGNSSVPRGSLAWFVEQLGDGDLVRTPAAIATVMRKWGLPEAALWTALEEVEAGGLAIRNRSGLFVSKLDGYGKMGRYAA